MRDHLGFPDFEVPMAIWQSVNNLHGIHYLIFMECHSYRQMKMSFGRTCLLIFGHPSYYSLNVLEHRFQFTLKIHRYLAYATMYSNTNGITSMDTVDPWIHGFVQLYCVVRCFEAIHWRIHSIDNFSIVYILYSFMAFSFSYLPQLDHFSTPRSLSERRIQFTTFFFLQQTMI